MNEPIENAYSFECLGSRMKCDEDDKADVRYRIEIAQATFSSLSRIWKDRRLSQNMRIWLYSSSICHTLTHACEAWDLIEDVQKFIRGFLQQPVHALHHRLRV